MVVVVSVVVEVVVVGVVVVVEVVVAVVVVDVVDVVAVVDVVGVVDVLDVVVEDVTIVVEVEVVVVIVDVLDVDNEVNMEDGDSVDVRGQGGVVSDIVVGDDVGEGVVGCLSGGSEIITPALKLIITNTNVETPPSAPPMVTPMTVTVVMLTRRLSTSFTLRPAAVFPAAGAEQQAARQQPSHRKEPRVKQRVWVRGFWP